MALLDERVTSVGLVGIAVILVGVIFITVVRQPAAAKVEPEKAP
jgi:multidrug transporter EmrE-like cation transporter